MTSFELWKYLHMSCAFLSVSGFMLRGIWMFQSSHLFEHKLRKVLPHFIDILLLASAIAMLLVAQINPLSQAWLAAKIVALLLYIFLGVFTFRLAKNKTQQLFSFSAALLCAAYIVQTAITKNPWVF